MIPSLIFGIKGYIGYTQSAFLKSQQSRFNPQALDVDLTGKSCVVTGSNSGLGYSVALELAKRRARYGSSTFLPPTFPTSVIMVCRNENAGQKALSDIVAETRGKGDVRLKVCDLSRPKAIRDLVSRLGPVDILINNAGALCNDYTTTPDGVESSYALNALGTYLLTTLLIPKLNPGARVVTVSSGGMLTSCLVSNQMSKDKYDGVKAYSLQKV